MKTFKILGRFHKEDIRFRRARQTREEAQKQKADQVAQERTGCHEETHEIESRNYRRAHSG